MRISNVGMESILSRPVSGRGSTCSALIPATASREASLFADTIILEFELHGWAHPGSARKADAIHFWSLGEERTPREAVISSSCIAARTF